MKRRGDQVTLEVTNSAPYAGYLFRGTRLMIERPILAEIKRRVEPRLTQAIAKETMSMRTSAVGRFSKSGRGSAGGRTSRRGVDYDGPAELPRYDLTAMAAPPDTTGYTLVSLDAPTTAAALQAAIDAAVAATSRPGTIIEVAVGDPRQTIATAAQTPILLRARSGVDGKWIVIRSAGLANLPAYGSRVVAADAVDMPQITATTSCEGFRTEDGACYYRLEGLEVASPDTTISYYSLIALGADQTTLAATPHHIVIDRCYLHGVPAGQLRRAVSLNAASVAVVGCHIDDIKEVGNDSQALWGYNGPGPFLIDNCFLEAGAETILFGGADPQISGLLPSDITITRNHVTKNLAWKGTWDTGNACWISPYNIKNLIEIKFAQRLLIEGNLIEYTWAGAQLGQALVLVAMNQYNTAPWAAVLDVTCRYNVIRHCTGGFSISRYGIGGGGGGYDYPTDATERLSIHDNLLYDVNGNLWGGYQPWAGLSYCSAVEMRHNTILQSSTLLQLGGTPAGGMAYCDNIGLHNSYGVIGADHGVGLDSLNTYWGTYTWADNVMVGSEDELGYLYPAGTYWPATVAAIGFVDTGTDDYRLDAASAYHNAASDGKDIGCDCAALKAAMASGDWDLPW